MSSSSHWSHSLSVLAQDQLQPTVPVVPISIEPNLSVKDLLDFVADLQEHKQAPRFLLQIQGAGQSEQLRHYAHLFSTHDFAQHHTYTHQSLFMHQIRKANQPSAWPLEDLIDLSPPLEELASPLDYEYLTWPLLHDKPTDTPSLRILFIDDFDHAHRNCLLYLSQILLYDPLPILLLVTAKDQAMMRVMQQVCQAQPHYHLQKVSTTEEQALNDLIEHMPTRNASADLLQAIHSPLIAISDRYRLVRACFDNRAPHHLPQMGDLDIYAALLGPQVPMKVLLALHDISEPALHENLSAIGMNKVSHCEIGGDLYAFQSPHHWVTAFYQGSQNAHQLVHILVQAMHQVYQGEESWRVASIFKRLYTWLGQKFTVSNTVGAVTPLVFWKTTRRLIQSMQVAHTPAFVFHIVKGLGYEWSQKGVAWGRWRETEYVLQNSVLAAQSVKDLWGAGRLLTSLGQVFLYDRKDQAALETLEGALSLLTRIHTQAYQSNARSLSNKDSTLLIQTFLLVAEANIQAGMLKDAWKRIQQAQHYANKYKFHHTQSAIVLKKSQLALMMNQADLVVEIYQDFTQDHSSQSFSPMMHLVLAHAYVLRQQYVDGKEILDTCESSSLKDVLLAYTEYKLQKVDPWKTLQESSVQAQSQNDMYTWLHIQHLRALLVIEDWQEQHDSLQADTTQADMSDQKITQRLAHTQKALARSIQVAHHIRDRLALIMLYFDLAQVLYALQDQSASATALIMAQTWSNTLDQPYHFTWQTGDTLLQSEALDIKDIQTQVQTTITDALTEWKQFSLSSSKGS